jgi:hypothetical protein
MSIHPLFDEILEPFAPKNLLDQVQFCRISATGGTMVVKGTYPEGVTKEEVEPLVRGSFGGRFESFGGGCFTYLAYTE